MSTMAPEGNRFVLRRAVSDDLQEVCGIITAAKTRMKAEGRTQWQGTYPGEMDISADIRSGHGLVLMYGDSTAAYCAAILDGEPAYDSLDGKWLSEDHYIVVHRMAVAEKMLGKGVSKVFFSKIMEKAFSEGIHSIKVDTNHDNSQMLHILRSMGFVFCGYIRYADGPRLAFEKLISPESACPSCRNISIEERP